MKNVFFLSFLALIFFTQCTPKTGDLTKKSEEVKDKVEEVTETVSGDFRKAAPAPGPAPKIQLGSYEQFELANGLKVIVVENHKLPRVTFSLSLDSDPFMEKEISGTSEMAGQLMGHGTKTKSKAQIDEEVDFMGATLNTSSGGIYAASLTKHTDNLLKIMSDVLLNPSFPEDEFQKVKKQSLSGLASSKDDPNAIASNVASVLRYGKDHPYGELMTEETVENITVEHCKTYYKNYFKPNGAYLIVVGDITPANAKTLTNKYFANWTSGELMTSAFAKPSAPEKTTIDFVNKTGAVQSVINVTYPVDLKTGSPDAIKANVMNTLLGGFFRSRLNGNLREGKGYTYGIRSSLSPDKEIGSFSTSAGVRNEVTDSSVIEIMYELNRLRTELVPQDELTLVKNYLSGSFARSLENPQTVARFALNTTKYNLPKDYYANYLENLSNVTAQDLMMMAQKYIKPENAHIVIVGNKSEVADKLKKIKPVLFYNNYGEEIKEEFNIPEGTTAQTVIDDYLNAIGGKAKLSMVKDLAITMKASMMGRTMMMDFYAMDGLSANIATVEGMGVMSKEVYNKGKVLKQEGGQTIPVTDKQKEEMKENAVIFGELKYAEMGYKLKFEGVENIDGVNCYVVELESPSGKKTTQYYSTKTSLKTRFITSEAGNSITFNLKDYKEVEGILFPHTNEISGLAPMPLVLTANQISVNKGIAPEVFKTE